MSRADLALLDKEIALLKQDREKTLTMMQAACKHPVDEWLETPYYSGGPYGYSSGELRVCKLCGYAEEGWGCGFWKLKGYGLDIPVISRDAARKKYILKLYSQRDLNELRYPNRNSD